MNPPHPEPVQFILDAVPSGSIVPREHRRKPMSDDMAAWVARKRRERDGKPLTQADREQVSRQLEDL